MAVLALAAGTALTLGLSTASAKPDAAQAPTKNTPGTNAACTASDATGATTPLPTNKTGNASFSISDFFLTKAREWVNDQSPAKVAKMAINAAIKLINLKNDPNREILKQLNEIEGQLNDIAARLTNLETKVDELTKLFNQEAFETKMTELCNIYIDQHNVYERQYVPMIKAAQDLAEIYASDDPGRAEVAPAKCPPAPEGTPCPTPLKKAEDLKNEFLKTYKQSVLTLEGGITKLHNALMPGVASGSVMTIFGRVLMAGRFITRSDSESLRALYENLAQTEALACWMDAEYRASDVATNPAPFDSVMKDCVSHADAETRALPPMIPEGAVIDLMGVNQLSTEKKPMWLPPVTNDQGWMPPNMLPWPNHNIPTLYEDDGVDHVITALNARSDVPGHDWKAPTKVQMTALMSDGCTANPLNPNQLVGKCRNLVPSNGGNVLGYMLGLNPTNPDWQSLFCENTKVKSCANGGAGMGGVEPHAHIWVSDHSRPKMECGYTLGFLFVHIVSSVTYDTYTGLRTSANSPTWDSVPILPGQVPQYGLQNDSIAHDYCNAHFVGLMRSPAGKAAVLATRYTSAFDRNPTNDIDYMAQPPPH